MARTRRLLACMLVASVAAVPSLSYATNGIFLIGYGTKSRGMGGVAIATPQDSIGGAVNPASIGFVEDRVDVGADFFVPKARSRLGEGDEHLSYDSSASRFVMPAMGGVYKFNRKISIGFSAVPAGGGGSRYNMNLYNNITGSNVNDTLGVNLMIMQMNPTASYRINKQNRIGASLVLGVQTFRAFGLDYFSTFTEVFNTTGQFPENMTNRGNDWAYGAGMRLGWMGRFFKERLSLGATYTSRVYMTKFDKYKELFAEEGDFDTPENFGAGVGFKITPKLMIGADIKRVLYSNVRSVGNASATTTGNGFPESPEANSLGAVDGLGFGWDDQTIYNVGVAYDYSPKWTYRAGWNYADSPIDEENGEILFNIIAPGVTRSHMTLGASYRPNEKMEWSFSFVHAFKYEQEGPTLIGDTGKIQMYQNSVGVSFGFKL